MTPQPNVDYQATAARYLSYLQADPDNPSLWLALGELQHRAGDLAAALVSYTRAAQLSPEDSVAQGKRATVLLSQHKFAEAELLLQPLVSSANAQSDPAVLHNLGLTIYFQRRWAEALSFFEQAAQLGLQDSQNLAYMAYALHHLGQTEQALLVANDWLAQVPADLNTAAYVSLLEMDNGDMPAAVARAEAVLAQQPQNTDASVVVGYAALEKQDADRARGYFAHITHMEPDNPRGWLGRGLIDLLEQRVPESIVHFKRTLEMVPGNAGIWVTLGWAQIANDNLDEAEAAFTQAIAVERTFGEAHGGLASVYALRKRTLEANASIRRARRLNPEGFGHVFAQSTLLEAQGDRDAAVKVMGQALLQRPRQDAPTLIEAVQRFSRRESGGRGPSPHRSKRR